jgi:hypothetical protein
MLLIIQNPSVVQAEVSKFACNPIQNIWSLT